MKSLKAKIFYHGKSLFRLKYLEFFNKTFQLIFIFFPTYFYIEEQNYNV